MVKKRRKELIILYVIIVIAIIIGGILVYNFLKGKYKEVGESNIGEETGIIATTSGGADNVGVGSGGGSSEGGGSSSGAAGAAGGGGGSGGGAGSAGGSAVGGGGTEYTNQVICQNAQNDNLCNGLDVTYGEGYRTLCCSEHSLCC